MSTNKGVKRVVYLKKGESVQVVPAGCAATSLRTNAMYKVRGQLDMVLPAELLLDVVPVSWCPIAQEWVE